MLMQLEDFNKRDYSLVGEDSTKANELGLINAQWYKCKISSSELKELSQKNNIRPLFDTLLWFTLLLVLGFLSYSYLETWLAYPLFALYGFVYALGGNSRWHEMGHKTAFKSKMLNEIVYQIASFVELFPPTQWRWSHVRHHKDTLIVGRDPEFVSQRPPALKDILLNFFYLSIGKLNLKRMLLHSIGILDEEEKNYIPDRHYKKVVWEGRIWVLVFCFIIGLCLYYKSILPILYVIGPTFYGFPFVFLIVITQHVGLNDDVLDYRLNTRTFYTNYFIRFLYSNMNYHLEHHMFPSVPYYNLPLLHEKIKDDCPPALPSLRSAIKDSVISIIRQTKNPAYTIFPKLSEEANPYLYGPSPYCFKPKQI